MNFKTIVQSLTRAWLMEEEAAHVYADALQKIFSGNMQQVAGLFDDAPPSYRVNSSNLLDESGEVLILPVSGVMMKHDSCFSSGTATLANEIIKANQDDSISSIVLVLDTPGGSVDGTEAFSNIIAQSKKPVIAFVELAASAGYWSGSSAREIVLAGETAGVGSIGTMAILRDRRAFLEANGSKEVVIFASRSTDKNKSSIDALDGKTEGYKSEFLDPLNAVFLSAVERNRAGKIDTKKEDVLTGKMYFGSNAIKAGLADKVAPLEYAVKRSIQLAKSF